MGLAFQLTTNEAASVMQWNVSTILCTILHSGTLFHYQAELSLMSYNVEVYKFIIPNPNLKEKNARVTPVMKWYNKEKLLN